MMIVILAMQEDRAERAAATRQAVADAAADAKEAEARARRAELLAAYRAGRPISYDELLELARANADGLLDDLFGEAAGGVGDKGRGRAGDAKRGRAGRGRSRTGGA